ncbi:ATP-dependent nuclease, subunit A [Fructilactobacillus florum 8D]|uniref:ATP-dependent helicase/nuclease subunit A n=1 Tax=Fructilactobacillus florum 8D TaxID=1221538 RepID=W9EHP9_9LACO|nr:helicase-exonuclease AddAB subunit AddA [Fructilactobacillus florum]ETO40510.1 ATP-dependent nuclease, subunit A [Fructilactobacillus florum 8D]
MSKPEWTPGQRRAIQEDFPGNTLVSASAGSGKTSVLTQRVLRKIKAGVNVDQLLIVTFTNAAAKEMRDRIKTLIIDELNVAQDPQLKQRLVSQLRLLPTAHIETLDAFCQWLVKKYYYIINLDPDFRILTDQSELGLLRDRVWETVREQLYGNDDGSFAALTRNFSSDRSDDGLTTVLFQLYDFANVTPDFQHWLACLPEFYATSGALTNSALYQKLLLPAMQNQFRQMDQDWQQLIQQAEQAGLDKHLDLFEAERKKLANLANQLTTKSWDELREQFSNFKFDNVPRISKKELDDEQLVAKQQLTERRTMAKKVLQKLQDDYFFASESENQQVMERSEQLVRKLVKVVQQFATAYAETKRKRRTYEFIDIEHFALQILTSDEPAGQQLQDYFRKYLNEIMVDEYQDNNRLQDAILAALKRSDPENLFMVGDVKQSIYRFRLADPSLFGEKYQTYPDQPNNTLITLPDNFRSVQNIDDFTNLLFSQIMNQQLGEIDYTGDNYLKFGAHDYPDQLDTKTEVLLYKADEPVPDEVTMQVPNEQQQVEMIAERIEQLIHDQYQVYDRKQQQMRPIEYGDIALLAATKHNNFSIASIFAEHQIPVMIDGSESYFKTTEIQIVMSLLQLIDNPYQDIPLAAVLRSPMVGMNENELAFLRITKKMGNYFQAVLDFPNLYQHDQPTPFGDAVLAKVQHFLQVLQHLRDFATQHRLAELIWKIYEQTGFLDYVGGMTAGKKRQANLHALYQRAEEYEKNGFRGLFAFVQFVKRLQKQNQDLGEAPVEAEANAVTVKTIHGSKGLEYPVVILMDANHGFNETDLRAASVLDADYGIGIRCYLPNQKARFPSLQYLAIVQRGRQRMLSEEMRKLYVAVTRAKQKLIITGIVKGSPQADAETTVLSKWEQALQSEERVLDVALRAKAKSFLDWIGPALVRTKTYQQQAQAGEIAQQSLVDSSAAFQIKFLAASDLQRSNGRQVSQVKSTSATPQLSQSVVQQYLNFQYPYKDATKTTAYQSVSEIKRQFDDPDNIQLGSINEREHQLLKNTRYNNQNFAEPRFMQQVGIPSPQEVGTATHLVLQKVDVTKPVTVVQVQLLIQQLVSEKLLAQELAANIKVDAIVAFYQTTIGQRILQHPEQLQREVPFSLVINADRLFTEFHHDAKQQLLVHGIIDGYLADPKRGVCLFDYKTSFVNPNHPETDIQKIKNQYAGQVNIYALALADMLKQPVTSKYLYLLSINKLIEIN